MGKIDDSGAKTVATGGGKISGTADQYGMSGAGPRRDAKDGSGGNGMAALMRKRADAIYAAASLQHVRTAALGDAIMHMRDADEAAQQGRPIEEVREFRRLARNPCEKRKWNCKAALRLNPSIPPAHAKPAHRKSPALPMRPPPLINRWSPTTTNRSATRLSSSPAFPALPLLVYGLV